MQTSIVFNQVRWPGAGDVDDCWVVSAIQAVNTTAPWLRLPSVPEFRKAAGKPDVQGRTDGGQLADIERGVVTLFPEYRSRLGIFRGEGYDRLLQKLKEHRPVSVAVVSGKLPARLQFGFAGNHQITLAMKADGRLLVANPLAPAYSRWVEVTVADVKPAILRYGTAKAGKEGVWAVIFPTDSEMKLLYTAKDDPTPFDQSDLDQATAAIMAERDALAGRIDSIRDIVG